MIILCRNEEKMLTAKEELQKSVTGQAKISQAQIRTVSEFSFQAELRLMEF